MAEQSVQRCRYSLPQTRLVVLILLGSLPQCLRNDNRQLSVPILPPFPLPTPLQAGSLICLRVLFAVACANCKTRQTCNAPAPLNQMQTAPAATRLPHAALCLPSLSHTRIYANVERSIIKLDLAADLASILSLNFSHENFELKFCAGSKNKFY